MEIVSISDLTCIPSDIRTSSMNGCMCIYINTCWEVYHSLLDSTSPTDNSSYIDLYRSILVYLGKIVGIQRHSLTCNKTTIANSHTRNIHHHSNEVAVRPWCFPSVRHEASKCLPIYSLTMFQSLVHHIGTSSICLHQWLVFAPTNMFHSLVNLSTSKSFQF